MAQIAVVNQIQYYITNPTDTIQQYLYYGIQWNDAMITVLKDLIAIRNLKHFLNIGAHIGTISIPISKHIQKVSAVEPYYYSYIRLLENIKLNGITNIQTYNFAVGDKNETVYLMDDKNPRIINNDGGMHVFTETDIAENRRSANLVNRHMTCNMHNLDDYSEIDDFDIIFVDIEGMEDRFLQGAQKKIMKNRPIIVIEIWNNMKRIEEYMNTTAEDIVKRIEDMNYKLFKVIYDDYIFIPL